MSTKYKKPASKPAQSDEHRRAVQELQDHIDRQIFETIDNMSVYCSGCSVSFLTSQALDLHIRTTPRCKMVYVHQQ